MSNDILLCTLLGNNGLMCVLEVEGNEEGEDECWAGVRDAACKDLPNPVCAFGPPVIEGNDKGESE